MAFLEVKDIKKSFQKTTVLRGIDFTLERGQVLSIIGSSGSGKTTLLRCLTSLETPDSGLITVGGEPIFAPNLPQDEASLRARRLHFGLVFQSFNLFPQYTVRENLTLAPRVALKEKKKQGKLTAPAYHAALDELNEEVTALLSRVGLSDKESFYPCQLSGGQQQRVAIARALALKPEILCFDEPTSALDPELTGEVLRVIRDLKASDRTMIVVTHEMEFARAVSDKVIFMADGVIAEEGAPNEVFLNPKNEKTRAFLANSLDKF